jgi:hypothetical protein
MVAVGALLLGVALPAMAQQQTPTVTFNGEMRTIGFVSDNVSDYTDTQNNTNRDSNSFYLQRFRLFTKVESADKKANAVWGLEIGDITWGTGGGSNGAEFGGTGSRVGNGAGGELGNDGVNVETKRLYLQFEVPFVPGARITAGIQGVSFLESSYINVFGDDASAIKVNWKLDPIDIEFYTVKLEENSRVKAGDDNDMYVAKIGVNLTADTRITVEGMVIDQNCFSTVSGACGTPANISFGDNFWVGATARTKVAGISLDGTAVYGQRQLCAAAAGTSATGAPTTVCNAAGNTFEESGWAFNATARMPIGPLTTTFSGFYTSGDSTRTPGSASNGLLTKDSDMFPLPVKGDSWSGPLYIAESITGVEYLANFGNGSPNDEAPSGLWGVGGAVVFSVLPNLSIGGGVAYIGTSDAAANPPAGFGDNAVEIDGGAEYQLNPNINIRGLATYVIPDKGDEAWSLGTRLVFSF